MQQQQHSIAHSTPSKWNQNDQTHSSLAHSHTHKYTYSISRWGYKITTNVKWMQCFNIIINRCSFFILHKVELVRKFVMVQLNDLHSFAHSFTRSITCQCYGFCLAREIRIVFAILYYYWMLNFFSSVNVNDVWPVVVAFFLSYISLYLHLLLYTQALWECIWNTIRCNL